MTLKLSQMDHDELCHGWSWTIEDEDKLADQVARVALGQFRHVGKILSGVDSAAPYSSEQHAADAIELLSVEEGEDPWHRDGWVFQTISWIAAHQQAAGVVTRPPHIIKAHKGFDGLQLKLSEDGKAVLAVIIFEDKATDDSREMIRKKVWPGIAELEAGKRTNQLTHDVTAALEAQRSYNPELDIDAAISNILWKEARHYRISITVSDAHSSNSTRRKLFKGFDNAAPGHVVRRRAETIHFPELRKWMQSFSERVISRINVICSNV